MSKPVYFKDWINGWQWGVRIALFLILLGSLMQFGMFSLTQNYMIAYLGAQPEDISFALLLCYAGIISILPVQFRFLKYFETRNYLVTNIMLAVLLNCLCLNCQDIHFFFILRFLQGILVGNTAACALILIFTRLESERAQAIGSAVFYGTILANTVLIGLVAAFVVVSADWKVAYYYLIGFQIITLLISLLALRGTSGHKPYPLYQIDWAGFILFTCTSAAFAYTMIYGSKYYWFSDTRILFSSLITFCGAVLFFYRQSIVKRPLIYIKAFKYPNFLIGLCLLAVYYGSKDSINLIYNYAGGVLKWSTIQVIALSLCNVGGIVVSLIISTRLTLAKRHSIKGFLVIGFLLMVGYNLWMCFLMTPDLSFTDLLFPVMMQGAASGFLFVPIIIFTVSSLPSETGTTGLVVAAYARFMASCNSVAGYYNLQLYFNQHFKEGFMGYLTVDNVITADRIKDFKALYAGKGFSADQASALANAALGQSLAQQTQLLTNRAVFLSIALLLFGVAMLILMIPAINKTLLHWNRRMVVPEGNL
ncbi:MFS transporter [Mucilaginibacter sp. ZT4R22]|uniref:MFS transporter n=1 Tax=Mucilaginibacter pankratovii TaxID=2772110 RepID=A0ABR7WM80_9SPHI|nr:MFS transporter [Mucilaginibacter pankratovii]MBD1362602.1 MFS transporter [Mucilaginibacter pankratovii]